MAPLPAQQHPVLPSTPPKQLQKTRRDDDRCSPPNIQNEDNTPATKRMRKNGGDLVLGVLKLKTGEVCAILNRADVNSSGSVVDTVLSCKNQASQFYGKFTGTMHPANLNLDNHHFGHYSYSWLQSHETQRTAGDLAKLFKRCAQMKNNSNQTYEEDGNQRVKIVELFEGNAQPMEVLYDKATIMEYLTSNYTRYKIWRKKYHDNKGNFDPGLVNPQDIWQKPGDHKPLKEWIAAHMAELMTTPTVDGLTF